MPTSDVGTAGFAATATTPDGRPGVDIAAIVERQRAHFATGATRPLAARLAALRRLRAALLRFEPQLDQALRSDLNKTPFESYLTETGMVLGEIDFHLRHLPGWLRPKRVATPITLFPASSRQVPEPYGVTLVMSPWNYPLQLCLEPVIGAISGGNCVLVKPSAYAPATSAVVGELIASEFDPGQVAVVQGGRQANQALLEQRFDHIFFTGSVAVGKVVMAAAARHPTPITLELGGKSPVIVTADANLPLAARRVAFGKVLNAGQTCVAPDYLLIDATVKERFLAEFRRALESFFPGGDHTDLPVIVSDKHFQRVSRLLESGTAVIGGGSDPERRFIEPTVLVDVAADSPVMQEEIFGPILPVLEYAALPEAIEFVRSRPRPLALYLFTASRETEAQVFDSCSFGGGCVNDTVVHLANPRLPFGGVGDSGMGSYHGRASFDTFTHQRSIVRTATWLDLPMRYHPYTDASRRLIRRLMR